MLHNENDESVHEGVVPWVHRALLYSAYPARRIQIDNTSSTFGHPIDYELETIHLRCHPRHAGLQHHGRTLRPDSGATGANATGN